MKPVLTQQERIEIVRIMEKHLRGQQRETLLRLIDELEYVGLLRAAV